MKETLIIVAVVFGLPVAAYLTIKMGTIAWFMGRYRFEQWRKADQESHSQPTNERNERHG